MRKQLLAYKINNQIIGVDIESWNLTQLNGNEPFKIIISGDTVPSGYTDIVSIQNWYNFGLNIANDYLVIKFEVRELVNEIGWNNLNNDEKDIAIITYSYDSMMDAITYLMTEKGMNEYQAQGYLLQEWHKHHGKLIDVCKKRWFYVKFFVAQHLKFADAEDLLDNCQTLIWAYSECGRLGIEYGDNNNGIMDYIESTNLFENQGLRETGYELQLGTWDSFITEMKNVLVSGIYIKYNEI